MKNIKVWTWGLLVGAVVLVLILTARQKNPPSENVVASRKNKELIATAQLCTPIRARLERLACFDKVFPASIEELLEDKSQKTSNEKPEEWMRAEASEALRKGEEGFRENVVDPDDPNTSMWFTARSQGDKAAKTILQLGCLDKISRVELLLPEPIENGRITVTVMSEKPFTQQWTSDESGTVLRPGRGLPAIRAMRAMLAAKQLVIRSDVPQVDELSFDNRGLEEMISPMRKVCGW